MKPRIVTMITTAQFLQGFDFKRLVASRIVVYEPEQFPGAFYYSRQPRCTVSIYSSGRIVTHGGKSLAEVASVLRSLQLKFNGTGRSGSVISNIQAKMITAVGNLQRSLDLRQLASFLTPSRFKPKIFPGLLWRVGTSERVILFTSGKYIITGARNYKRILEIWRALMTRLEES